MCTPKIMPIPDFYLWNNLFKNLSKCAVKIPVRGKNVYKIFLDLNNDAQLISHFARIVGNFQGFS